MKCPKCGSEITEEDYILLGPEEWTSDKAEVWYCCPVCGHESKVGGDGK